jgi:hypothetical protein
MKKIVLILATISVVFTFNGCGVAKKVAQTENKNIKIETTAENMPGLIKNDGIRQE